jgi:NitT/TauT family transport system substrate-binding protein
VPIRLAENFRAVFYAPFYAAQALGFYAREGIEVELLSSPASAAAQKDFLDGTVDLSWSHTGDEGPRRGFAFSEPV